MNISDTMLKIVSAQAECATHIKHIHERLEEMQADIKDIQKSIGIKEEAQLEVRKTKYAGVFGIIIALISSLSALALQFLQ